MQKVSKQQGFTLIELIIVIVLLGILAVTAAPKFLNLQDDARDSVLQGIAGSIESAASIVYGKSLIQDAAGVDESTVVVDGTSIGVVYGYPDAGVVTNLTSIIEVKLGDGSDYAAVSNGEDTVTIYYTGDYDEAPEAGASCSLSYVNSTGEGLRPVVTVTPCEEAP